MDVARADTVDTELDRLISRRASQDRRPDSHDREEGYIESVRAYNAARSKERRAEWYSYHLDQAERLRRTIEPLIALHEARAAALCEEHRGEGGS